MVKQNFYRIVAPPSHQFKETLFNIKIIINKYERLAYNWLSMLSSIFLMIDDTNKLGF